MKSRKQEFLDFLNGFQEWVDYDKHTNEYETGIRCALGCVNDVTKDYRELFVDFTKDVDDVSAYIEDTLNNILSVLSEALRYKSESVEFNKGYKEKMQAIIEELKNYKQPKDT